MLILIHKNSLRKEYASTLKNYDATNSISTLFNYEALRDTDIPTSTLFTSGMKLANESYKAGFIVYLKITWDIKGYTIELTRSSGTLGRDIESSTSDSDNTASTFSGLSINNLDNDEGKVSFVLPYFIETMKSGVFGYDCHSINNYNGVVYEGNVSQYANKTEGLYVQIIDITTMGINMKSRTLIDSKNNTG